MRRLLALLSALSLLLCGAAGVMWWRSWRHAPLDEDRISWLASGGDRMTIRSDVGQVTLFEPPAWNPDALPQLPQGPSTRPGSFEVWSSGLPRRPTLSDPRFHVIRNAPGVPQPTLKETVAAIRNDQVEWFIVQSQEELFPTHPTCSRLVQVGSPAFLLSTYYLCELVWEPRPKVIPPAFQNADAIPSLLPALEDPQRFVIAHLLLRHLYPQPTEMMGNRVDLTHGVFEDDGLHAQIAEGKVLGDSRGWITREGIPAIDPAQLPRIRDQWHRRLDVAKVSAPWWAITATLALMPLVWLAAFVRRGLRRRQRQCARALRRLRI